MDESNVSIRAMALSWWKLAHIDKKQQLHSKYKPNWTLQMLNASSSTIEYIYRKEHNLN